MTSVFPCDLDFQGHRPGSLCNINQYKHMFDLSIIGPFLYLKLNVIVKFEYQQFHVPTSFLDTVPTTRRHMI